VGFVRRICTVEGTIDPLWGPDELARRRDANEAYCPDALASEEMIAAIKKAKKDKDTLGGVVEVQVHGAPPGLGSCARWQDKLDGRLMQAVGAIQAFKGVEIGLGFGVATRPGSEVHDPIGFVPALRDTATLGFTRPRNNAGGIEGGMTNGEDVVIRVHAKPIPTARRRARTFDMKTLGDTDSPYVRSDVCVIPALSVIAEAVAAWEILDVFLDKFGGDTIAEALAARDRYLDSVRGRFGP
jgi:chorismate synthase